MSDVLAEVKAALIEHDTKQCSCNRGVLGFRELCRIECEPWLRALVARCEVAEAALVRVKDLARTEHDVLWQVLNYVHKTLPEYLPYPPDSDDAKDINYRGLLNGIVAGYASYRDVHHAVKARCDAAEAKLAALDRMRCETCYYMRFRPVTPYCAKSVHDIACQSLGGGCRAWKERT